MALNIENFKKVRNHFYDNITDDMFDYSTIMFCNSFDLLTWWSDPEVNSLFHPSIPGIENIFRQYHEVPCGTVCCVAGETWIEFAKTPEDRSLPAPEFTKKFLGLGEGQLHTIYNSPGFYGKTSHYEVAVSDVIKTFDRVIRTGELKYPVVNY